MPGPRATRRLTPSARVRKRLEFEAAQDGGRRATTAHFVLLLYARGEPNGPARLGIVASRKIGNAVVRNRAKRLVREAFRTSRDLFRQGIDVVVIVKKPLQASKLADIVSEWRGATQAIGKRSIEAESDLERRTAHAPDAGRP